MKKNIWVESTFVENCRNYFLHHFQTFIFDSIQLPCSIWHQQQFHTPPIDQLIGPLSYRIPGPTLHSTRSPTRAHLKPNRLARAAEVGFTLGPVTLPGAIHPLFTRATNPSVLHPSAGRLTHISRRFRAAPAPAPAQRRTG